MAKTFTILLLAIFLFGIPSAGAVTYTLPVRGDFRVTQPPGGSFSHYKSSNIEAWDLAGSGVPVSVADGVVSKVAFDARGYGNYVTIKHPDGLVSLYAHLASVSVSTGQNVIQGEQIGIIGDTGKSTGKHLHFSLFKDGKPYSTDGLINFSSLRGGIITKAFDIIFPKLGGTPVEPLRPIDLKPIGDMVAKFYDWALNIGVAVSTGIVIWGGVLYILAADDPSRSKEAKKWVMGSIYGLVLLVIAYLILYTINPCLVGAGPGCT